MTPSSWFVSGTLAVILSFLLAASRRRPATGAIGLLALTPFYYVLRGTAGQTAFAFLWPYLYLAAYTHIIALRALVSPARADHGSTWERNTLAVLYAVLALAALVSTRFVLAAATQSVGDTLRQFNGPAAMTLIAIGGVVAVWPLVVLLGREPRLLRNLRAPDWAMTVFVAYGVVQLLLSLARTGHFFYSAESFRYYFLMAWTYFVLRFGLETERDAKMAVTALVTTTLVVAGEFVTEHFLFNAGVASTSLPWLGAFDRLFAGYGRPIPVDGFYIMTRYSETVFLPYHGIRGMGLFIHPHTAGFYVALGALFLIPRYFDARRGGWLVLAALMLIFYGNMLTLSRAALMLMYAALVVVPVATAWILRARFAVRRVVPYTAALLLTLYAGAKFSPGGELPFLTFGWYQRPIVFSARAALGDTQVWAMTTGGGASREESTRPSATAAAGEASRGKSTRPSATAAAGEISREESVRPSAAAAQGRGVEDASSSSRLGLKEALQATLRLLSETDARTLVVGYGFSPLTKYVVDFFPEASGFRHLTSNSDLVLLEFMQQFGLLGLATLFGTFAVFGRVAWLHARSQAADGWSLIALAVCGCVIMMALALVHLYPLFRIGVNTSYYGILGVLGFLHAESRAIAGVPSSEPSPEPVPAAS